MRKLQCELCNGVDLVKEGDYFVCQNCGCKYTAEDARKIIQLNGPVTIDHSGAVRSLTSQSFAALEAGDYAAAYDSACEATSLDPDSSLAWIAQLYALSDMRPDDKLVLDMLNAGRNATRASDSGKTQATSRVYSKYIAKARDLTERGIVGDYACTGAITLTKSIPQEALCEYPSLMCDLEDWIESYRSGTEELHAQLKRTHFDLFQTNKLEEAISLREGHADSIDRLISESWSCCRRTFSEARGDNMSDLTQAEQELERAKREFEAFSEELRQLAPTPFNKRRRDNLIKSAEGARKAMKLGKRAIAALLMPVPGLPS